MHITNKKDIAKHEGETVAIEGVYTKSIVAVKPGSNIFSGRYKLQVNDSLDIIILPPYKKGSVRPQEEVERFEGKRVVITGVVESNTYLSEPSLENSPQTVSIPCFISVEKIELLND